MKLRLFPTITSTEVDYMHVDRCPLCDGTGIETTQLTRRAYRFSTLSIPLPSQSVKLIACPNCDLLYKDHIPTVAGLTDVMERAAEDEWKEKPGLHPSLEQVLPFVRGSDVIDIGAAQGDLLRAVAPYASRRSAFDVVVYERCKGAVTGEYVVGTFENIPNWSGDCYDVVTAYDVFEHFLEARPAVANIAAFLRQGGHLLIETGDWRSVDDLDRWYYCNLFEHQIFWSHKAIDYLCNTAGMDKVKCDRVNHKFRRNVSTAKRAAIRLFRAAGFVLGPMTGIDARLLPPPAPNDHLFAVLRKK
jgi:SAM-dependent methyltransferase